MQDIPLAAEYSQMQREHEQEEGYQPTVQDLAVRFAWRWAIVCLILLHVALAIFGAILLDRYTIGTKFYVWTIFLILYAWIRAMAWLIAFVWKLYADVTGRKEGEGCIMACAVCIGHFMWAFSVALMVVGAVYYQEAGDGLPYTFLVFYRISFWYIVTALACSTVALCCCCCSSSSPSKPPYRDASFIVILFFALFVAPW